MELRSRISPLEFLVVILLIVSVAQSVMIAILSERVSQLEAVRKDSASTPQQSSSPHTKPVSG